MNKRICFFYPDDSEILEIEIQVSSISESSGSLPKTFQQQPYLPDCQRICHEAWGLLSVYGQNCILARMLELKLSS